MLGAHGEIAPTYVGRFAPSPTGPLHFGSAITAIGSYVCARAAGGRWHVRIDDIDPARELPVASGSILRTLARLGLDWDGPVSYQSTRREQHQSAVQTLLGRGAAYRCICSRQRVAGPRYPGTCRTQYPAANVRHAVRILAPVGLVVVRDRIQGEYAHDVQDTFGDFVIWRVEDLPAYHLATVLDDAVLGVTEVVRGADLLDSTPRQRILQSAFGLPTPSYAHLPLALDRQGFKLSKQTGATALDDSPATAIVSAALGVLGHAPPRELAGAEVAELLNWARQHWQLSRVPRQVPATVAR